MSKATYQNLAPGYLRHPSTNTAHFFSRGTRESICKRETRTIDGELIPETDFMVCSFCQRAMVRKGLK